MSELLEVKVPDMGDFKDVGVIEVMVKPGDTVKAEDPLITLESDKATVDVPSPASGVIKELKLKIGDKVSAGSPVLTLEAVADSGSAAVQSPASREAAAAPKSTLPPPPTQPSALVEPESAAPSAQPAPSVLQRIIAPAREAESPAGSAQAHAGPSVRRLARELGVDLSLVKGSGQKNRILREDVNAFVKSQLATPRAAATSSGFSLPPMPEVDFSKFGAVELQPLTRIQKLSGTHLHRNWLHIPHVTQHGDADITELEAFRKSQAEPALKSGIRFTLLAFLMKALVVALKQYPTFNASLASDGENLVLKHYFHIGVAVDTPHGLVVPVIRDADKKGLMELAKELGDVSGRMREGRIKPDDVQGGSMSISSLGGIGGSFFTPIINAPEVAILGVGRSTIQPVWNGKEFVPRLVLPLSLSYDHRVIDGAQGARFVAFLGEVLSDIRRLVL